MWVCVLIIIRARKYTRDCCCSGWQPCLDYSTSAISTRYSFGFVADGSCTVSCTSTGSGLQGYSRYNIRVERAPDCHIGVPRQPRSKGRDQPPPLFAAKSKLCVVDGITYPHHATPCVRLVITLCLCSGACPASILT
jgi:hypothetical protein